MVHALTAADLRATVVCFRDALRAHQEELNRLNVYPVPDGDTGTNMALTLESVLEHLNGAESMSDICHGLARGSLMGARGNSGVILSQVLRGLAETFKPHDSLDAATLAEALRKASDGAYQAVMRPVEGTILTVVRAAAEAAERVVGNGSAPGLGELLDQVAAAASDALAQTPELLPQLAQAGVVDAGGRGFLLLLDSFLHVVTGRPVPEPEDVLPVHTTPMVMSSSDVSELRYEVMFFLEGDDAQVPAFRERWADVGDSIVVVGGEGTWNCHIHTNDVGAAIEAALDAGRPRSIRVTDLAEQVDEERWVRDHIGGDDAAARDDEIAGEPVTTAVVVVGVGDGIRRLFQSLGAQAVIAGGQSMNPSTQQLVDAVERVDADNVIVLPNNKNIVPVARQVAALTDKKVEVIPTTAVVEGLAALVAYDPENELQPNVGAMSEAATRVRAGEVTRAVRDSQCDLGPIRHGDWLSLTRGDGIVAVKQSAGDAVVALADQLVDGDTELVTVLVGCDAHPADTARLLEHLATAHAGIDAEVHEGGQPLYPYLLGVE